jgi:hypothetical protein
VEDSALLCVGRCFLIVGLGLLSGCGTKPELAVVQGQVHFRGQPLNGGVIVFVPDTERGPPGNLALSELTAEGRFELKTKGQPGCRPGWHRISIASGTTASELPAKYRDPLLSGQEMEVKPGVINRCVIRLD